LENPFSFEIFLIWWRFWIILKCIGLDFYKHSSFIASYNHPLSKCVGIVVFLVSLKSHLFCFKLSVFQLFYFRVVLCFNLFCIWVVLVNFILTSSKSLV
jgi:hypothetical protein